MTGTTQSTLSIANVTLLDQGMYQCSATNVDGINDISVAVQVAISDGVTTISTWSSLLIPIALLFVSYAGN